MKTELLAGCNETYHIFTTYNTSEIPEGTVCNCGKMRIKITYCPTCGSKRTVMVPIDEVQTVCSVVNAVGW